MACNLETKVVIEPLFTSLKDRCNYPVLYMSNQLIIQQLESHLRETADILRGQMKLLSSGTISSVCFP